MSGPLDRLLAVPGGTVALVRHIREIAGHTAAMKEHTSALEEVAASLNRVADATSVLPHLNEQIRDICHMTAVLEPMDGRMATIEDAMPTLVDVQRDLSRLPAIVDRLDGRAQKLNDLLDRLMGGLDELATSIADLQESVKPLGRAARRLPGGRSD